MSSGFVTEAELEEKKIKRQEEWERVRKPEDPEEAPDEPQDHRSLFDRLEEQRQKKQEEWDEEHKFKNQFRGLDDDEVDFLDKIDDIRTEAERQRYLEERKELEEYQKKQEQLREQELEERLRHELKGPEIRRSNSTSGAKAGGAKSKQQKLLMGAVKRKSNTPSDSNAQPNEAKKSKASPDKNGSTTQDNEEKPATESKTAAAETKLAVAAAPAVNGAAAMAGLLAAYSDSDDSENEN